MLAYRNPSQIPDHKRLALLEQLDGWSREWASRRVAHPKPTADIPQEVDHEDACGDAALDRTMPSPRVQELAERALLKGHEALAAGDMTAAVTHYRRARNVLPGHTVPACWAAWAAVGTRDYRGSLRLTTIASQNGWATSAEHAAQALAYLGLGLVNSAAKSLQTAEETAVQEEAYSAAWKKSGHIFCSLEEDWEVWQMQCREVRKEMDDLALQSHIDLEREIELIAEVKVSERKALLDGGCKQQ